MEKFISKIRLFKTGPFDDFVLDFSKSKKDQNIFHITGPNGSGKSTILYAIASTFSQSAHLMAPRMWADDSFVEVQLIDGSCRKLIKAIGLVEQTVSSSFDANNSLGLQVNMQSLRLYLNTNRRQDYVHLAQSVRSDTLKAVQPFTWAIFTYSSQRSLQHEFQLQVAERTFHPLSDSAHFVDNPQSIQNFIFWVANTITKKAILQSQGKIEKMNEANQTLLQLQSAISEIIGKAVTFEMEIEPLSVKMKIDNKEVPYISLPAGVQSIVAWLGDLLMRLDNLIWEGGVNVLERPFTLLLDEVEVHLHLKWQKRILPIIAKVFPNAQIILSTHSPFVVSSFDGAVIFDLNQKGQNQPYLEKVDLASIGSSYQRMLTEIFDVKSEFSYEIENQIFKFREQLSKIKSMDSHEEIKSLKEICSELSKHGIEVSNIITLELIQFKKQTGIEIIYDVHK